MAKDQPDLPQPKYPPVLAILIVGVVAGVVAFKVTADHGHPITGALFGLGCVLGAGTIIAIYLPPPPQPPVQRRSKLEHELDPILTELEAARLEAGRRNRARGVWAVPLGAAAGLGLWLAYAKFSGTAGDFDGDVLFGAFAALVGGTVAFTLAIRPITQEYERLYKLRVLPKLTAGFGALTYRRPPPPDVAQLKRFHLFGPFDAAIADDAIVGEYRGVAVNIVQLRLTRRLQPEGFVGLFVEVSLKNRLSGSTAIGPQAQGWLDYLREAMGPHELRRVGLEDPEFERDYEVWSTDQVMARALVTPDFMQRFKGLNARAGFGRPIALAQDNRLLIALPLSGVFFHPPPYLQNAFDAPALAGLRDDIGAVLKIIDPVIELDADTRRQAQPTPDAASP